MIILEKMENKLEINLKIISEKIQNWQILAQW